MISSVGCRSLQSLTGSRLGVRPDGSLQKLGSGAWGLGPRDGGIMIHRWVYHRQICQICRSVTVTYCRISLTLHKQVIIRTQLYQYSLCFHGSFQLNDHRTLLGTIRRVHTQYLSTMCDRVFTRIDKVLQYCAVSIFLYKGLYGLSMLMEDIFDIIMHTQLGYFER